LLKTIRANKNLHYLTERLPKSNYENGYEVERTPKNAKGKSGVNTSLRSGLNLPMLDRVIIKSNNNKMPVIGVEDRKPYLIDHKSLEGMLKIEGRSQSRIENDYDERRSNRDIKAELRKIYNLRPSPKKSVRRNVQLPRLK
jgi:hypothetical protein